MTVTLDPGFIWQLIVVVFLAGGGWASLHLSVRWLERKQDIKLAALKDVLDLEIEAIKEAHAAHVARYEREHGELKVKVEGKGESVTTLQAQIPLIEKRIDEKIESGITALQREFRMFAHAIAEALGARFGVQPT